jgi:hypothetical protein
MRFVTRAALFFGVFLIASPGFAAPSMKVTVFNGAGKVAFQGTSGESGTFATDALAPGRYIVQFNSKTGAVKGQQYSLVVSAGKKKVVAYSVDGEKFLGGGAAMRIEVGAGLKITGQIGGALMSRVDPKTGKRLVWLSPRVGSNLPGHWVPEDSAEFVSMSPGGEVRLETVRKWQDKGDFGH